MQPHFRLYTRLLLLAGAVSLGQQAGAQNMPQPQDAGPSGSVTNTITLPPALQAPASGLNYVRRWAPMIPLTDPAGLLPASDPAYAAVATEYKDGFNRSLQTVQVIDLSKSVVTVADNRFIPQQYSFLPYVSGSTNFRSNAFQEQKSYYNAQYPSESAISYGYAENSSSTGSYQASSYAPGLSQAGQSRATRTLQGTNGANEVRIWSVDASGNPVSSGYYSANQLFLQTVVAPVAGSSSPAPTSRVYKDKEGHVVLEQKADSSYNGNGNYTFASTYYVYDDMGQLRYVLPPRATELLEQNSGVMTSTILNNLCFQYQYDDRGRQVAVHKPGEIGFTEVVYDRKDRAVMRRSNQEAHDGQWELSFYDAQGRVKATALYDNSTDRSNWQAIYDNGSSSDLSPWMVDPSGEALYPGDNAVTGLRTMSYTWYDDYSNTDPNDDHWNDAQATLAFSGELQSTMGSETPQRSNRTQSMITGTQVRIIRSEHAEADMIGEWRTSIPYYDDKGRVISSVSWSWYNGDPSTIANIQYTATQFDFAGRVRITKHIATNEKDATGSPETHTERTRYTYDAISGRLSQTTHKVDNGGWTQLNAFTYDDLGRVQRKIIGNNGEVQDYSYNIRGQLSGINGLYAETGEKNGYNRSFGESLKYDYGFSQPRYDGKIAGMIWRGSDVSRRHAYGYGYDLEGRLKTADYNTESTTSVPEAYWTNSVLDYSVSNLFYDKNGNILSMKQRGVKPGSGPIDMDVLGYQYEDGGQSNRLASVTDNAASTAAFNLGDFQDGNTSGADYSYDLNGNLGTDLNKSISDPITYTWFNKPVKVVFPGSETIEFSYDAAGNKIQELQSGNSKQTDYIGNFVYENRKLSYILTAEGRTHFNTGTEDSVREEFFVKDHLGNVRSVTNVYTYNPIQYLATYEVASAGLENLIFNNIDDVRAEKPSSTDPNDIKSAMLDGATNPVGTSLLVKVMAGDQVGMNVNNFYQEYDPGDDNPLSADDMLSNIIGTLTGGAGGVTGGESHDTKLVSQLFNTHSYTEVFNGMLESFTDPGRPKAYLNYVFFDENMHLIPDQSGAWQVNGNGTWESIGTGNDGPRLVRQNGYLAVFLTNRSRGTICANCSNVYFDWLNVTITKGQLLEEDHYYPHGLPIQGLAGVASGFTEQRRKYQSNEYIKDLGLNWMDFNARQYDPQIGRFLGVDPLADADGQQIWSPYAAMGNAPESMVDPNGTVASINTSDADAIRMVINSLVHNYGDHVENGAFVSDDASAYKAKEDFQKAMDNMDGGASGTSAGIIGGTSENIFESTTGDNNGIMNEDDGGDGKKKPMGPFSEDPKLPPPPLVFNYPIGLKKFVAIVAGESTNNTDEATAIGDVLINRMKIKGTSVYDENFVDKIGGSGQYDAIGGTIYNEIMGSDWSKILDPNNIYASRISGAMWAYKSPTDYSKGGYLWNASSPHSGFNWDQYDNGTYKITVVIGGTTFFKYSNSSKTWP